MRSHQYFSLKSGQRAAAAASLNFARNWGFCQLSQGVSLPRKPSEAWGVKAALPFTSCMGSEPSVARPLPTAPCVLSAPVITPVLPWHQAQQQQQGWAAPLQASPVSPGSLESFSKLNVVSDLFLKNSPNTKPCKIDSAKNWNHY